MLESVIWAESTWGHRTFTEVVLVDSNLSDRLKLFGHHDDCFLTCNYKVLMLFHL